MNFNKVKKSLNFENILLGLILVLIVYIIYKIFINKDNFEAPKCCPPTGSVMMKTSDCGAGDGPNPSSTDPEEKCGKLVMNGTGRCTGEGVAFPC